MCSGWTGRPRMRSRSWPAVWWRSRSPSCSRHASRSRSSKECESSGSVVCGTATRGNCWPPPSAVRWTNACGIGSSPRRWATHWRCWSCRAAWRRRSLQVDSSCRARCRCRTGSKRASCGGSRRCRRRPGSCCWSRRRSRSANRRAWHRAQATSGTDEDVAAELEQSAGRAHGRGGVAAAAAFLERAVGLTADPARRAQRALAAAQAKHLAGAPDAALELLATAREGPLDELGLARMDMLRAQIAYSRNRAGDAPPLLLRAAKRLEPLDVTMARETYLDALSAAWYLGRLASSGGVLEVAQATLAAPKPPSPRAFDLLLDGVATRFTAGYAAGASMLKRALAAFPSEDISSADALRWLWLAVVGAVAVWDDRSWEVLATRWVSSRARPACSRSSRWRSTDVSPRARS